MITTSFNVISKQLSDGKYFVYLAQIPTTTGIGDTEEEALALLQQNLHVDIIALRNDAIKEEGKTGLTYKVLSYEATISTELPVETLSDSDEDTSRKATLIHGLFKNHDQIEVYMASITRPCERAFLKSFMAEKDNKNFGPVVERYREMYINNQKPRENGS